jgi:hypothetical protein
MPAGEDSAFHASFLSAGFAPGHLEDVFFDANLLGGVTFVVAFAFAPS